VIAGVPAEFDELVLRATARDPADRFADALEMGAAVDDLVDTLGLPPFRVPAPRNSAEHASAALFHSRVHDRQDATDDITSVHPAPSPPEPPRHHTRVMVAPPVRDRFAGIDIADFHWARQRAKRVLLMWVIAVITLTGLLAAGAWTLGSNLPNLL
jgi:serine/threonine-protein kinase